MVTPTGSRAPSRSTSGNPTNGMSGKKKGKKIKTKKIELPKPIEDDPKYLALLDENQQLEINNTMLR